MSQFGSSSVAGRPDPDLLQQLRVLHAYGGRAPNNPLVTLPPLDTSAYVDATAYGVRPNTGVDLSDAIETAWNAAHAAGKCLLLQPGAYVYTRPMTVNASLLATGLVCLTGIAHMQCYAANLSNVVIDIGRPAGSAAGTYVAGFVMQNIKFSQPNRADTGLRNDAPEQAVTLRMTYVDNIDIRGCRFEHLYGSAMIGRSVKNAFVIGNVIRDIFKDGFHFTGESSNIYRCYNLVEGGGDDAFPIVGYTNLTEKPRFIFDIGNRVRGVRFARAFAYVGCSDVVQDGCYIDGKMPSDIPQQFGPDASLYLLNTRCAQYIAAETFGATPAEKTYGNERIRITNFEATNLAPGVSSTGTLSTGYEAITIFGSNAANEDISIEGTIKDFAGRGFVCSGANETRRLKLDLVVENNRDPNGLASLTATPNTVNRNAVEFQRARDIDVRLRCKNIGKGAIYADLNCTGKFKAVVSIDSVNMWTGENWAAIRGENSVFSDIDVDLTVTSALPLTGAGSVLYGLVSISGNCPRRVNISGQNAVGGGLGGWPARQLTNGASGDKTLPASPATYVNVNDVPELVAQKSVSNAANISAAALNRAGNIAQAQGVTGTTVTLLGDWSDRYTTAVTTVACIDARGFVLSSGLTPSAVSYSSGTRLTTVTLSAVPADTVYVAIMGTEVVQTGRANAVQRLEKGMALKMTYSGGVDVVAYQAAA